MTQQPRALIALDLDGTVLNHGPAGLGEDPHSGQIDPQLRDKIRALAAAGHEVVIATGRSTDATLPVVEMLGIRPRWIVVCNGAVTLTRDPLATRGYRTAHIESFSPGRVLQELRTKLVGARFAVELVEGGFLYTEPIPLGTLPAKQRQVPFEELLTVQASRVVVVSPDANLEESLSAVEQLGLSHVSYVIGSTLWLDIAPEGVSKASALSVIAAKEQIAPEQFFAAGDGSNDVAMLQWAGARGDSVAMGQAVPAVQQAARRVTATVDDNGLLTALCDRFGA